MAEANQPKPQLQPLVMSPEQVAELMEKVVRAVREPSDEEKQAKAQAVERRKEEVRQSMMLAEQDLNNRMTVHRACDHSNERTHTFVGNNMGDGNTVALCLRCGKDYKWRTTNDQLRQGTNLLEIRGLKEEHLLAWERQFPAIGAPPDRLKLLTRAGKTLS